MLTHSFSVTNALSITLASLASSLPYVSCQRHHLYRGVLG